MPKLARAAILVAALISLAPALGGCAELARATWHAAKDGRLR